MTWPLMILGALSLGAGFLNPEALHALGLHVPLAFEHWLAPGIEEDVPNIALAASRASFELPLVGVSTLIALSSIALAWTWYRSGPSAQAARIAQASPGLHALVLDKWRIDELYDATLYRLVRFGARAAADFVDRLIVDGLFVHGAAWLVKALGSLLRIFQTGRVQVYAMFMAVGTAGILFVLAVPTSWYADDFEARVTGRHLEVTAIDGVGYQYRWDFDGDGRWDTELGDDRAAEHDFARAGHYKVRLEIQNPFMTTDSVEEIEVAAGRRRRR